MSETQDTLELTKYELMAIVTPDVPTTQYQKYIAELKKFLEGFGASIWHEEDWGKRELAYTIKKQDHGYYFILNFEMDPAQMPEVNAQMRIMAHILRYLIVKTPDGYTPQTYDLDALDEKPAKTQPQPAPKARKAAPAPKKAAAPAPAKKAAEKKAEKEADLSKLDAKLDEILSDDSDLNL